MTGCLTKIVNGAYRYYRRGLKKNFNPDLKKDGGEEGWISFKRGKLTDDKPSNLVGWKGLSMGEEGVDILIDLKGLYFIDKIILKQEITRCVDREEARSILSSAVSEITVYTKRGEEDFKLSARMMEGIPNDPILKEEIPLDLGEEAGYILIHVGSFRRDVLLKGLEIWGSDPGSFIFPVPQEIHQGTGSFPVKNLRKVVCGKGASEDTYFSARFFIEEMKEITSLKLTEEDGDNSKALLIGKPDECSLLDNTEFTGGLNKEGYILKITEENIFLAASDRLGLIYGVETLLGLICKQDVLPVLTIIDFPRTEVRGVHLWMPAREDIPFYKRLVKYVLVPMKINTIFLQVTSGMKFDRRPEINDAWEKVNKDVKDGKAPPFQHGELCKGSYLSKEEVKDLVDYSREYGMELIPEIQSLSHVEYLTITYPDIAEDNDREYPDCYCPSNPKSYEIVFDMIDEIAEVFGSLKYVSMGHDEVYTMGRCPECKGKTYDELFAGDVKRIYDYLKKKGLRMMIWGDMLQPFRWYSSPKAIIPKDIILLDFVWYFRTDEDIENRLLGEGFKVIMGNLYSSHYTRFNTRIAKKGMIGGEVSTWTSTSEYELGKKGKIYDFIYTANMLWSNHYEEHLRWSYTRQISQMIPIIRQRISGGKYPSLAAEKRFIPFKLKGIINSGLIDENGSRGGFNLISLHRGETWLRDSLFYIGDGLVMVENENIRDRKYPVEAEILIDKKINSLLFLHSMVPKTGYRPAFSGYAEGKGLIGSYLIIFNDGTKKKIKIELSWNIGEINRRYGEVGKAKECRHLGYFTTYGADPFWQGKTPDGRNITLYGYEWLNPHPEKIIKAVKLNAIGQDDSSVILIALTGVCF
ncbi:MAG: family 20 glycosylhydrolase [Spirochaetes bacterium]|nr:family 20 glycosylhydrolase [Spirochaetota bacterium]